jgi:hypothetical protein
MTHYETPDVPECGKCCNECTEDCESRVYDFGERTRDMIDSVFFKFFAEAVYKSDGGWRTITLRVEEEENGR